MYVHAFYPVVLIWLVKLTFTMAPSRQPSTTCSFPSPSFTTDASLVSWPHAHAHSVRKTHETSPRAAMFNYHSIDGRPSGRPYIIYGWGLLHAGT